MTKARAQIVSWGNSRAVRIPKTVLEQSMLREGDYLDIRVENGNILLQAAHAEPTLEDLVAKITPHNRHGEQDWGKRAGNEVW